MSETEEPAFTVDELVPERASFTIRHTADKVHWLRALSIEDNQSLVHIHGAKGLAQIFKKNDLPKIAQLIYKLLEDRTDFPAENMPANLDEKGEKLKPYRRPGHLTFLSKLSGFTEQYVVMEAFCKAYGLSQVLQKHFSEKEIKAFKKKEKKAQ